MENRESRNGNGMMGIINDRLKSAPLMKVMLNSFSTYFQTVRMHFKVVFSTF